MTIKQQGGIFGRNPTFNDVDVDGNLTAGQITSNGAVIATGAGSFGDDVDMAGDLIVGTNTLFVDAANNAVGIGTSILDSAAKLQIRVASDQNIGFQATGGNPRISAYNDAVNASLDLNINGAQLKFETGGLERFRVPSGGGLLVGKTSGGSILVNGAELGLSYSMFSASNSGTTPTMFVGANGASGYLINFYYGSGIVGGISTNGTTTTYSISSDYRLKEDVQTMVGASDRVLALNPVNFAWKSDGTRVDGFLAHEAQAVVPEAVTGDKDAVDAEGNPEYQRIDQSKFVPLLTAALQEALGRIKTLEAEVAALKGQ